MRLVFAGTPEPAVPSLQRLIESPHHEVVAVITRPDAVSGRGRKVRRSPVGQLADSRGIPVLSPRSPAEPAFLQQLAACEPDCCPVVAYGALLPA
ncbi:MAG: formyltransferase family protein, partial [Mycobacteriaceae bacterium]